MTYLKSHLPPGSSSETEVDSEARLRMYYQKSIPTYMDRLLVLFKIYVFRIVVGAWGGGGCPVM